MTANQQAIKYHAHQYNKSYTAKFGCAPTSWFTYLQWLAINPSLGSFTDEDVVLAKKVLSIC